MRNTKALALSVNNNSYNGSRNSSNNNGNSSENNHIFIFFVIKNHYFQFNSFTHTIYFF